MLLFGVSFYAAFTYYMSRGLSSCVATFLERASHSTVNRAFSLYYVYL